MSALDSLQSSVESNPKQKHSPNSSVTLFCQANSKCSQVYTAVFFNAVCFVLREPLQKCSVECYSNKVQSTFLKKVNTCVLFVSVTHLRCVGVVSVFQPA